MKFIITEEHIKAGQKGSLCHCPIALAVREIFPHAFVFVYSISTEYGKSFPVSKRVQIFIKDFDSGKKVKPFSFTVKEL